MFPIPDDCSFDKFSLKFYVAISSSVPYPFFSGFVIDLVWSLMLQS